MTSRQRVIKALNFEPPDRVPIDVVAVENVEAMLAAAYEQAALKGPQGQ